MSKRSTWGISENRYVAYIDIMGFKDMVARNSHTYIYEMMKRINDFKNINEKIFNNKENIDLVKTTTYSDSIIVYSKDESFKSFETFTTVISGLTDDMFNEGIPHKGAFAFGMMTLDVKNSIFFGQPLIDAYLLQEELYFYGIVGHSTAEKKIDSYDENTDDMFITNYSCPFKKSSTKHLAIHPMAVDPELDSPKQKEDYINLMKTVNKLRHNTSGDLRKYIENTELYFDTIRNRK